MSPAELAARTRRRARRGEGEKLRDEILDAAEKLLRRTGDPDAVSIRMITDAVGCTAPSIYRHFPDKATLIYEVCERHFDALHAVFEQRCGGIEDPVEALHEAAHAYLDFGVEHPEAFRVMFLTRDAGEAAGLSPATLEEAARTDASFGILAAMVERVMEVGVIRSDDPLRVAVDLWTICHGVTVHAIVDHSYFPYPDPHEQLDRLIAITMRGLAP